MSKRKSKFTPPSVEKDKSLRRISPIGLSLDYRLLTTASSGSVDNIVSTDASMISNAAASNVSVPPPANLINTTPTSSHPGFGGPRPILPATLPTRPALSNSPVDPMTFSALPETEKLNIIYTRNVQL